MDRAPKKAVNMDMVQTMQLGANMADDLRVFKLNVKNRRLKVDNNEKDQFEPIFKAKLWKVKVDGDRMQESHWFEREMWISKNGSLVYWSNKEERELIYYTRIDIRTSTISHIDNGDSFMPWAFKVQLPPAEGVEFAAGEFAAESESMRLAWIDEFKKFQVEP